MKNQTNINNYDYMLYNNTRLNDRSVVVKKKNTSIAEFIEMCDALEKNKIFMLLFFSLIALILSSIIGFIASFWLRILFSVLVGNLIVQTIFLFTVDKQYKYAAKKINAPLKFNFVQISEKDKENISPSNPKIPGIEIGYSVKDTSKDIFAVAIRVSESSFHVLNIITCDKKEDNKIIKINSDVLTDALKKTKKSYVYDRGKLILSFMKLKINKEIGDTVDADEIFEGIIFEEDVLYPYIK